MSLHLPLILTQHSSNQYTPRQNNDNKAVKHNILDMQYFLKQLSTCTAPDRNQSDPCKAKPKLQTLGHQ